MIENWIVGWDGIIVFGFIAVLVILGAIGQICK